MFNPNSERTVVTVDGEDIVAMCDDYLVVRLTPDAVEGKLSALLRVNGDICIYRVIMGDYDVTAISAISAVIGKLDPAMNAMYYTSGVLTVRNKANSHRVMCRTLMFGATPFAQRGDRLVFLNILVPGLGKIHVPTTGETNKLYVQLNNLL